MAQLSHPIDQNCSYGPVDGLLPFLEISRIHHVLFLLGEQHINSLCTGRGIYLIFLHLKLFQLLHALLYVQRLPLDFFGKSGLANERLMSQRWLIDCSSLDHVILRLGLHLTMLRHLRYIQFLLAGFLFVQHWFFIHWFDI